LKSISAHLILVLYCILELGKLNVFHTLKERLKVVLDIVQCRNDYIFYVLSNYFSFKSSKWERDITDSKTNENVTYLRYLRKTYGNKILIF
jgi:hypothetical protein